MMNTERLILRQWKQTDHSTFIKMGSDPEVMKYFHEILTPQKSIEMAEKIYELIEQNGWGFWAVELKDTGEFIGFIGLHYQPTLFEFSPCVEIGWRLLKKYWGKGYATEGGRAALTYAFEKLNLNKVVAFTACVNKPSEAVMRKLGMKKVRQFKHPELPAGHFLQDHVLYEIDKDTFIN